MKKYSVYDLYVVSYESGGIVRSFICKKKAFKEGYFEVLTGDFVEVQKSDEVVPLINFYSPLTTHDMTTGKGLRLSKEDILKKYLEINDNSNVSVLKNGDEEQGDIDACKLINVDEILDKAVDALFPDSGWWGSDCYRRPNEVSVCYIPCNLRDDVWIAKLLRKNSNLYFIGLNRIISYLKSSSLYKEKRDAYEQEIVRWQINWMRSGGDNWIVSDEYGGDFIFFDENYDIGFRKSIVATLEKIGMNHAAIEEGIERNAAMWRDALIESTFRNRFDPLFVNADFSLYPKEETSEPKDNSNKEPTLCPASDELRSKWIMLRKYEYYQEHKDSVDAYGTMEEAFLLTSEEVKKLRAEVQVLGEERLREIKQYEEERKAKSTKTYIKI